MKLIAALCACALMSVAGCAGTRSGPSVELEPIEGFEVSYRGAIGEAGDIAEDLPEFTQSEEDTTGGYTIEARILQMPLDEAEATFGDNVTQIGAFTAAPEALQLEVIQDIQVLTSPRLTIFNGQTGTITLANETAYISGFEIEGQGDVRTADPKVDIVNSGMVLGLRADSVNTDRVRLSLDLLLSEVVTPVATQEVKLFGSPVTIQTPVVMNQRLKAEGEVSEDRVLVLTGMVGDDNRVTIVLLKNSRMDFSTEPGVKPGFPKDD